jgi:hypothetical protein
MAKVERLTKSVLIIERVHVTPETVADGDDFELGIRVIFDGHYNGTAREGMIPIVATRSVLVELLTEIARCGAHADRELPSELAGAIEAGVEKARKEAVR